MSATNHTTNYNLPIFVGSDKPAWLVDFNGAMNAIDAAIKGVADDVAAKSPALHFVDSTNIDFTTEVQVDNSVNVTADLSAAAAGTLGRAVLKPATAPANPVIPSVDDNNDQVNLQIGAGLAIENGELISVDLDLIDNQALTLSISGSASMGVNAEIRAALNDEGTIGKIYGYVPMSGLVSGNDYTITTNLRVAATGEAYEIYPAGMSLFGTPVATFGGVTIQVSATGAISIKFHAWASGAGYIYLWPCLYFFKNFGDVSPA